MNKGDNLTIHSYKHNGSIHRAWDEAVFLEETKDYVVFGNNQTLVTEADGRTWKTKEPAIIFFYKHKWFNVICQFKEDGIYYYCNMASPYIIEDDTIKYIDYDLDLRVFADESYKVLDKSEYKYHKEKMEYPEEIDVILKRELNELIKTVEGKKGPFDRAFVSQKLDEYKKIKKVEKSD